jgi:hypothetical protein
MRDPDLVLRAQRAASALERAWERWRVMHGFGADPLPPVSSYVGYSLEEPWGQPRVVFGIGAEEAEKLAAILDGHDCVGPVHAEVTGRLTNGPAALPEWQLPDGRLNVPAQPAQPELEQEPEFRASAQDGPGRVTPLRSLKPEGGSASAAGREADGVRSEPPVNAAEADQPGSGGPDGAGGHTGNSQRAGSARQAGNGQRAGSARQAGSGERARGRQQTASAERRSVNQPAGSGDLPAASTDSTPLAGLPPFPDDGPFAAEFAAAPVPIGDDGDAVTVATAVADSPVAKSQRRKVSRPGPLQAAKRSTRTRRPAATEAKKDDGAGADQAAEPDAGPAR